MANTEQQPTTDVRVDLVFLKLTNRQNCFDTRAKLDPVPAFGAKRFGNQRNLPPAFRFV